VFVCPAEEAIFFPMLVNTVKTSAVMQTMKKIV